MIQIGNTVVDAENFHSIDLDKMHKKLSKQDPKQLAAMIIDLSEQLYDLQKTNRIFHQEMMSNKTSIGGVTVDR